MLRTGLDSTLWISDSRYWNQDSLSVELLKPEFRIFIKPKLGIPKLKTPGWFQKQKFPWFRMIKGCEQSLFSFRFSEGSTRGQEMQEKRRETRLSCLAPWVTRVVICVPRAFCSTDWEKRETARILGWLPYMGRWIDKVVTYGEKKGKGSARRRERRLTPSLACVAGYLAADALLFWRPSHVKIGGKSRRDFHLSPSRFRRSLRVAAFRLESTPGAIIPPATQATLSFTSLHTFKCLG